MTTNSLVGVSGIKIRRAISGTKNLTDYVKDSTVKVAKNNVIRQTAQRHVTTRNVRSYASGILYEPMHDSSVYLDTPHRATNMLLYDVTNPRSRDPPRLRQRSDTVTIPAGRIAYHGVLYTDIPSSMKTMTASSGNPKQGSIDLVAANQDTHRLEKAARKHLHRYCESGHTVNKDIHRVAVVGPAKLLNESYPTPITPNGEEIPDEFKTYRLPQNAAVAAHVLGISSST